MPTDTTDGQIATTSQPETNAAVASPDAAAPASEAPELDQNGEPVEQPEASAQPEADGESDAVDPDADIKALFRGETQGDKPLQAKPAEQKAPETKAQPFEERFKTVEGSLSEHFDAETAEALKPLLDLVKDQQKAIETLTQQSGGYGQVTQYIQAQQAQALHGTFDRLADNGYGDFLGSMKDGTANMQNRAKVARDAGMAMEIAQQKGQPITEDRALEFALRMNTDGGKSPATAKLIAAAKARQGRMSIAPKATAGGAPRAKEDDNPDADAIAAVRDTRNRLGIGRR